MNELENLKLDTSDIEANQEAAEEKTIPGVRILFTNGQTFDLPTISQLDETPPTYESIVARFRDEKWIRLGASNITVNAHTVSAVSEIRIKVVEQSAEQNQETSA